MVIQKFKKIFSKPPIHKEPLSSSLTHSPSDINSIYPCSPKDFLNTSEFPKTFSAIDLVIDLQTVFKQEFKERQLDFQLDFGPEIPEKLLGTPKSINQILNNLIRHLILNTKMSGITITCLYFDNKLMISVSDNGCGIESKIDKSFDIALQNSIHGINGTVSIKRETQLGTVYKMVFPFIGVPRNEMVSAGEKMILDWLEIHGQNTELVNVFYKSLLVLQSEMTELYQIIASGQPLEISQKVHAMKGFPGGFGLNEIYYLLLQIESEAKKEPIDVSSLKNKTNALAELFASIPEHYFSLSEKTSSDATINSVYNQSHENQRSVLVAEDNQMNQEIIRYVLTKINCSSKFVENGYQVLEALEKDPYDLLLLDMQMPGMDGFETISRIRADDKYKYLPVIAVTAKAMLADEKNCKVAGCDEYIPKPIIFEDMIHKINQLVPMK